MGSRAAETEVADPFAGPGARTVAADVYDALALLAATRATGCLVAAETVAERPLAALTALRERVPAGALGVLAHPDHPAVGAAARRLGLPVVEPASPAPAPFVTPPPDREPPGVADWPAPPPDLAAACLAVLGAGGDVAAWLAGTLADASGAGRVSVLLLEPETKNLVVAAVHGADAQLVGRVRVPAKSSLAGRALAEGRPELGRGTRDADRGYRGTAYVLLPLRTTEGDVGVACLTDLPGDRAPDRASVLAWTDALLPAGRALGVAARLARAERDSVRDALTGLPNRRAFERAFARELERARRARRGLGLAVVDIDHFKAVNDELGHDLGDVVLREVARRLADALRETDLVARWGGEEFILLLPEVEAGADEGLGLAVERVRERVAAFPVELGGDRPPRTVTVSIGLASLARGDQTADLMRRADQALYRAKRAGRNRVERG
ncbi:MAG: diguanylate cyclase [Planctomycetota bacterium]